MAVFFRPAFKSGIMVMEDRDGEGKIFRRILKASDNGKDIELSDEAFVVGKYPHWFMDQQSFKEKKASRRAAKESRSKKVG